MLMSVNSDLLNSFIVDDVNAAPNTPTAAVAAALSQANGGDVDGTAAPNVNWSSCWDPLFIPGTPAQLPPAFSECFQNTALVWAPTLFFWLFALPSLAWQVRRVRPRDVAAPAPLPPSRLAIAKHCTTAFLALDASASLFERILSVYSYSADIDLLSGAASISASLLRIVTCAGMFGAYRMARRHGMVTSGALHSAWLLHTFFAIPECYGWMLKTTAGSSQSLLFVGGALVPRLLSLIGGDNRQIAFANNPPHLLNIARFALAALWLLGCSVQSVLHFRADRRGGAPASDDGDADAEDGPASPELAASWFSRLALWWFNSVPLKSVRGTPLIFDDIFALTPECRAARLAADWERTWAPRVDAYKHKLFARESNDSTSHSATQNGFGYQRQIDDVDDAADSAPKSPPSEPSIAFALFTMFRAQMFRATLIKMVGDLLQFANPLLLKLLIDYVASTSDPLWMGFAFAFSLFFVMQIRSFLLGQYFYIMFRMGVLVQSTLQTAVYKKALRLSSAARRDYTAGEIVNLMAIDSDRFQQITPQLPQLWSAPMQITLSLLFLFQTMGVAALPGVLIMATFIPVSIYGTNFSRRWQRDQMSLKDKRARLTGEMFAGVRVVKLYAWERPMAAAVERIRAAELRCLGRAGFIRSCVDTLNTTSPFLVAISSFLAYSALLGHALSPQVAFVSLTLFNQLRFPMTIFGQLISYLPQWSVSNTRLRKFLLAKEIADASPAITLASSQDSPAAADDEQPQRRRDAIRIRDGDFSWDSDELILKSINLSVAHGELLAVVGRVGSGKSSLLSAIIGEMEQRRRRRRRESGEIGPSPDAAEPSPPFVQINGRIAYVSQTSWIQNASVRANILFGQPFDEHFYWDVIHACALQPDLELLPAGDMTEIGERGINLSGGQKVRLSLARAVYQRHCDVYLLDDTLSAVDAHVGRWLFERVIGPHGMLGAKTRVFVTHGIGFLDRVDRVAIIEDDADEEGRPAAAVFRRQHTDASSSSRPPAKRKRSRKSTDETTADGGGSSLRRLKAAAAGNGDALIQKEHVQTESVSWSIYGRYVRAAGARLYLCMPLFIMCNQALTTGRSFWLSSWSDDATANATTDVTPLRVRLGVYAAFGCLEAVTFFGALLSFLFGGISASRRLHTPQLERVLGATLSFFEQTPVGRLLNRFGKDVDVVDAALPTNARMFMNSTIQAIASLVTIIISVPIFGVVAAPIAVVYFLIVKHFVPTSRQLKRLESSYRSPVYSHFGETINGISVIRAFRRTPDFVREMERRLDRVQRIRYLIVVANRWITIRLSFIGACIVLFTALFGVIHRQWEFVATAGMIGLAVTYALNITDLMNVAVRQASDVESNIVSVERLSEYEQLAIESNEGICPPVAWPERGHVRFDHYTAKYRATLAPALREIVAEMGPAERIGIVGRTGAGKTTLSAALFRTLEHTEGRILVDSVDIARIQLQELRSRFTIIPQDPTLFTGSLRFNLDPFERHTDAELWRVLEMAHLSAVFSDSVEGLEYMIAEGGENLSVGQRQLLCLARALLRRSKIVIMDEATASVDLATDALVRDTVAHEFRDATLLTIAHRLDTVIDYDRVMVLERGRIREFAAPQSLLADTDSAFSAMVHSAHQRLASETRQSSTAADDCDERERMKSAHQIG